MRRWLAIGCLLACTAALSACGDDDGGGTDGGTTDGGRDGGGQRDDGGGVDPCVGRDLCDTAGTSCDGETLVTCAADVDGCLVESRNSCPIEGQICDATGGSATCVDPCSLLPEEVRCETDGARACDGERLEVCGADANGCLVLTTTQCDEVATDGFCNEAGGPSGDMAACDVPGDPCEGVTQCAAPSRACSTDNTSLVVCAANEMGCLVETTTPCGAPDVCDATDPTMVACVTPRGANNTCATAESISATRTIQDEDIVLGGTPPPSGDTCDADGDEHTLYYELTIPALTKVDVAVSPDAEETDLVLLVLDSCSAADCSLRNDDDPEVATLVNGETTAVTRIVAVHGYAADETGTYDISFTYAALAPNGACPAATPVTGTASFSIDTTLGGLRPPGSSCSGQDGLGAMYYAVTVPPGGIVDVVTSNSSLDRVLSVLDSCAATNCSFSTDSAPERTRLVNRGTEAMTQIVTVHPYYDDENGMLDLAFNYPSLAPNSSCAMPQAITGDTMLAGQDLATGGPRPTGTGCEAGSDSALYYAVQIPPMTVAQLVATPASGTDIAMVQQDTCGGTSACVSATDSAPETLRLANATAAMVTRYVAVHGSTTSTLTGTFSLAATFQPLAPNASCASAEPVDSTTGTLRGESTTLGGPRPAGEGCATNTGGSGTLYYSVTVDPGSAVDVVTSTGASFDRVMVIKDACDATACTYHTDADPEAGRIVNTTSAPITRIVAVHPYSTASGTYDIAFNYTDLADNAACAAATPITEGSPALTGQSLAGGGPRPVGTGCSTSGDSRTLYYTVTIPSMRAVDVVATPTSGDIVLLTQDSCGAAACSSRSDSGSPERARLVNTSASAVTRLVSVHGTSASAAAPVFNIAFNYATIAPNSICSGAEVVSGDRVIAGDLALGGPRPTGTSCGSATGNSALYYTVTVPANSAVDVTATPAASLNIALTAQESCTATSCASAIDAASAGNPERTTLLNATGAAITRSIAVFGSTASSTGTFSIQFDERPIACGDGRIEGPEACDDNNTGSTDGCSSTCEVEPNFICTGTPSTCRAVAPNAFCAGATAVTADISLSGENPLMGGPAPTGAGCSIGTTPGTGRALYYAVTIPPQTRVEVTTTGTLDRVLITQDACNVACTSTTDSSPERATLRNNTSAPITRIVVIHPYSSATSAWGVAFAYHPYACGDGRTEGAETCDDGNTTAGDGCAACAAEAGYACVGSPSTCISGAPANAYCAAAEPIAGPGPVTLTGESTAAGGPRPTGANCGSGSDVARTLYYAVTIPAAQQVTATASSVTGNVVLFSQTDCAETSCLGSSDTPDRINVVNATGASLTRIIGVRSSSTTAATYNLTFTFTPSFVAIPGACVDASAGTVLAVSGDSDASPTATLPIPFTFFGTAMTHWAASSNGLLQIASSTFSGYEFSGSDTIPDTDAPNGYISPFWDDLVVSAPGSVRWLVTGADGSRRFVVEWNQVEIWNQTGRLTFQAHLLEGSNAIELHYCSSTSTSGRFLGNSATIGIENSTGTDGVLLSFDTAGAATPGNGFRFTPLP
ncbi:myxococcus cysteine-rich repeat containing protein [Sandaracinus amylolyticus]|uniref:Bacillopeptidase F n=1 Tax=Sandaracinus amylolyticus TaxID=927083 RepID=A0A0F6SD62_9BACT|nr:myxococcus cysteine-rich repeat containing protein [Sandaracinus amylolyticus]AKF02889.1 bacillopeptidase F [Sandaracinus amylolyticus]